jgi:hypothetical protein
MKILRKKINKDSEAESIGTYNIMTKSRYAGDTSEENSNNMDSNRTDPLVANARINLLLEEANQNWYMKR